LKRGRKLDVDGHTKDKVFRGFQLFKDSVHVIVKHAHARVLIPASHAPAGAGVHVHFTGILERDIRARRTHAFHERAEQSRGSALFHASALTTLAHDKPDRSSPDPAHDLNENLPYCWIAPDLSSTLRSTPASTFDHLVAGLVGLLRNQETSEIGEPTGRLGGATPGVYLYLANRSATQLS